MRFVHIEFIPMTRWKGIWLVALLLCLVFTGTATWQWLRLSQDIEAERQSFVNLSQQVQNLRAPAEVEKNPRSANAMKVAQLLQRDFNPVFATIENLKITGVRLVGLTLDSSADTVRMDYELETLSLVAQVTEQLNSGYTSRPWKLNSVSATAGTVSSMVGITVGAQKQVYKATWSVNQSAL